MTVSVVTLNALAKLLCDTKRYPGNKVEHLEFTTRIPKIKDRLLTQMRKLAIICLQEIDHAALAELIPLFEKNGYAHASANYGNAGSGYFGVLIAWPRNTYEVTRMKFGNATNEKKWLSQDPLSPKTPDEQIWFDASQKKNQYIFLEFDCGLVVGTYHMPCEFQSKKMMTIFASNIAELIFEWADGRPFILAGDFNIKPHDTQYAMLTGGHVDETDEAMPVPLPGDTYRVGRFVGLESAYAVLNGEEPGFTNHVVYADSETGELCPFTDTLDYVFYHGAQLTPVGCLQLVCGDPRDIPPFPSEDQPSDHLMLGVDFDLNTHHQ